MDGRPSGLLSSNPAISISPVENGRWNTVPGGWTVIVDTTGRRLRGRYAVVTEVRTGPCAPVVENTARHCRYRAFGLAIGSPPALVYGLDHALQVSSGVAVLPVRVKREISPWVAEARQRIAPQLATVPASRTSDSYVPRRAAAGESANSFPGLLAAPMIRPEGSRSRAVTCRAVARARSVARAGLPLTLKILPSVPVPTSRLPDGSMTRSYGASSPESQRMSHKPSAPMR